MISNAYDIELAARNELESGERLLWTGQPDPRRLSMQTVPILFFGIPWTAFAIFWVAMAAGMGTRSHSPGGVFSLFPLFGVPFILIGFGMLSAPYWAYRKATRTVYAVTDRRLLIIAGGWSRSVQSYDRHKIGMIERRDRPGGSGDIIFARQTRQSSNGSSTTNIGFFGIPDVRTVERLVRQVASDAPDSGGS